MRPALAPARARESAAALWARPPQESGKQHELVPAARVRQTARSPMFLFAAM